MTQRLLFIKNGNSAFIAKDEELVREFLDVLVFDFKNLKGFAFIIRSFQFILFYITKGRKYNTCLIWFANFHSVLPTLFCKLLKKKSIIILGGSDVNDVNEIGYGASKTKLMKSAIAMSIKNSSLLLPVSKAMLPVLQKKYGKKILAKVTHLPTGYDKDRWIIKDLNRTQILTVASFSARETYLVKGLDRFVAIAKACPEIDFVIVGARNKASELIEDCPSNLTIKGLMTRDQLVEEYNQSSIYLQLSRSEGLPNAVCEAMLSGCYPIGTSVGGVPDLIQNHGSVLSSPFDILESVEVIKQVFSSNSINRNAIRDHIVKHYSIKQRRIALQSMIGSRQRV